MKLLLRREQKESFSVRRVTSITFQITARAELTPQERDWIGKYQMEATLLYTKMEMVDRGSGVLGVVSRLAFKMRNEEIRVYDLVHGKTVESDNIIEILAIEEQIKQAAENFSILLKAAGQFGGEEVLDF